MDHPYLVPRTIREIFTTENTLWIGDSTARQDYQTLYRLMHLDETNDNITSLDLPRDPLNRDYIINRGKRGPVDQFHCPVREAPDTPHFADLGQVKGTDQNCYTKTAAMDENGFWSNFSLQDQTGKFDLSSSACLKGILSTIKEYKKEYEHEYSVLIISSGIWEVIRPWDCKGTNESVSHEAISKRQEDLLDFLLEFSGPSMFVIYKTHGPSKHQNGEQVRIEQGLVNRSRDWFGEKQPKFMDLADFHWAIRNRTYGPDRIDGDLKPHWGLEARLLSIELISNSVRLKQERRLRGIP